MRRFGIIVTAGAALVAAAAPPSDAGRRPRPTEVPPAQVVTEAAPNALQVYNDYATPGRTYSSERAVVHYVVLGVDAPPLNDDDADGIPDYVERVGEAADTAIAYYERRGFAPILADEGGPDARPDIYVTRFAAGYFGVAFPPARARGGAFVTVSNALDPSPTRSLGSLMGTVAHELFHLVQFSYFSPSVDPPLAPWTLEGTAAALESRVYPGLDDIVSSLQLRPWFSATRRSLTEQAYGAQLLWRFLDERRPQVLPEYIARLARRGSGNEAATLAETYASVSHEPFARAFGRFATWAADRYAERLAPTRTLTPSARAAASVAPLAIHLLRLPRAARSVVLRFRSGRAEVALLYQVASERAGFPSTARRVDGRTGSGGRTVTFAVPAALRGTSRASAPTLVIANGRIAHGVAYDVAVGG